MLSVFILKLLVALPILEVGFSSNLGIFGHVLSPWWQDPNPIF